MKRNPFSMDRLCSDDEFCSTSTIQFEYEHTYDNIDDQ